MKETKTIETRITEMDIPEEGIFRFRMKEGVEVELSDVIELSKVVVDIAADSKFCTLTVIEESEISATPEAREYSAKLTFNNLRLANAIVVNSLPIRIMSNFFLKFNRPVYPVKLFSNEEEAKAWLRTFLK